MSANASVANLRSVIDRSRAKKRKGYFWKNMDRKILFLFITLASWPIILFLSIFRFIFQYIFLVYPGTDRDLDGFCWRKLAKSDFYSGKPSIAGIITKGDSCGVRGIYFVVPNTVREFISDKFLCLRIARRLRLYKKLVGAKSIALAGQAPGLFLRHEIDMQKPFVDGIKGTVFCVMETIAEAKRRHNLQTGCNIAVVGVGTVGGALLEALRLEGERVYGIDIKRRSEGGVILPTSGKLVLGSVQIVVVLTPKGSDFEEYLPFVGKGTIIIDDTHPMINKKPDGVVFYKVAMQLPGARFLPSLPGYRADWIPGCAVQAIYSAKTGDFNGTPQTEFNRRCRELGFQPYMG